MSERYFEPWVGKDFGTNRTLLLSESTYDWLDDEGAVLTPQPKHPESSIKWNIQNFRRNRYFTQLNRALCMGYQPSPEQMKAAWDALAYTVFVQDSVGLGAGVRPTEEQWYRAGSHFLALLKELRPSRVIVTGREMWAAMPECDVRLIDDLQAYELEDGLLVWCLALPHPANRRTGFRWDAVGESMRTFRATTFPTSRASAQLIASKA